MERDEDRPQRQGIESLADGGKSRGPVPLGDLLIQLRDAGAEYVDIVIEEGGENLIQNREIYIETEAIYGHWDTRERLRRTLTGIDSIRWDWTVFDFLGCRIGSSSKISLNDRKWTIRVFNRDTQREGGNGMNISGFADYLRSLTDDSSHRHEMREERRK